MDFQRSLILNKFQSVLKIETKVMIEQISPKTQFYQTLQFTQFLTIHILKHTIPSKTPFFIKIYLLYHIAPILPYFSFTFHNSQPQFSHIQHIHQSSSSHYQFSSPTQPRFIFIINNTHASNPSYFKFIM